jgi:hypothetical protein
MLKTFKYPVVHFPFNRFFTRLCQEQDMSIASRELLRFKYTDDDAKYLNELLFKFARYITPIIGGGPYLISPIVIRICEASTYVNEYIQRGVKNSISILIPLTSMFAGNSINVEEPPFSRCFRTISADPGSFVVFDGPISQPVANRDLYGANFTGRHSIAIYFELVPIKDYPHGLEGYANV